MLVSLCGTFPFITIHLPLLLVVSDLCTPWSPLFFQAAIYLSPKLSLSLTRRSDVLCSGTKHNDSFGNTHFEPKNPNVSLFLSGVKRGQEYKRQQKRHEKGTAMKRASV